MCEGAIEERVRECKRECVRERVFITSPFSSFIFTSLVSFFSNSSYSFFSIAPVVLDAATCHLADM